MTFITNLLKKEKFAAELLFRDTDNFTYEKKKNQKMFMKDFLSKNTCLTSVTIQKSQSFFI